MKKQRFERKTERNGEERQIGFASKLVQKQTDLNKKERGTQRHVMQRRFSAQDVEFFRGFEGEGTIE